MADVDTCQRVALIQGPDRCTDVADLAKDLRSQRARGDDADTEAEATDTQNLEQVRETVLVLQFVQHLAALSAATHRFFGIESAENVGRSVFRQNNPGEAREPAPGSLCAFKA
jgi:hypothetical protein